MKKITILLFTILSFFSFAEEKIKIGVTLQPYYSFVANIVKDRAEIITPVRLDIYNSHNYSPTVEDMKKISSLDTIVINGLGHDSFIYKLLKMSGKNIPIIEANKNIKLMYTEGICTHEHNHDVYEEEHHLEHSHNEEVNSHTYISITESIEQIEYIADQLGKLDPKNREFYLKNAKEYTDRLAKLKKDALNEIKDIDISNFKVVTFYAGYDYLFKEFGKKVDIVIEPAHGVEPSIVHLQHIIKKLKAENIKVIFGEKQLKNKYMEILKRETRADIKELYHMTGGSYSAESFEEMISQDLNEIVSALKKEK